ncbi:tetratricopeptide repeat protein [Ahniella affigens]|nr:SEL1-like repeat protein [Ahniella affigens]
MKKTLIALALAAAIGVASTTRSNSQLDELIERATSGDIAAQRELGQAYLQGTDVARDDGQGVSWLTQAADAKDTEAAYLLGDYYGRMAASSPRPNLILLQKQAQYLKTAAIAGHPKATLDMAELLLTRASAEDVPEEKRARAIADGELLLRHGADNGYVPAMIDLADRLETGRGIKANPEESLSYRERAATKGDKPSQYRLYTFYSDQQNPRRSETRARLWLKRAADAGHGQASADYARMLMSGQGTPKNLDLAAKYVAAAEAASVPDSVQLRKDLDAQRKVVDQRTAAEVLATTDALAPPSIPPKPDAIVRPPETLNDSGTESADSLLTDPVVAQFSSQIQALEERLQALGTHAEDLKAQVAERDSRIAELQRERDAALAWRAQSESAIAKINRVLVESGMAPIKLRDPPKFQKPYQEKAPVLAVVPSPSNGADDYAKGIVSMRAKRYEEARTLFERASSRGHTGAANNLGLMLVRGLGGPPAVDKGIALLVKAANAGSASAAESLAAMYDFGIGVERDRNLAIEYYELAVRRGSEKAKTGLARLQSDSPALSQL